jgi:hypothetical protein
MAPEKHGKYLDWQVVCQQHFVRVYHDEDDIVYDLDNWLYSILDGLEFSADANRYDFNIVADEQLITFEDWHQLVQYEPFVNERRERLKLARTFEELIAMINYDRGH